nr:slit homolog 2 protein-like [Lytechinus pictus]
MASSSIMYSIFLCLLVNLTVQYASGQEKHLPTRSSTVHEDEKSHVCDQIIKLKKASCRSKDLDIVPQNLSQDIEILDLGWNNITRLLNVSFEIYPLISDLDISSNNLRFIEPAVFYPLKGLTYLDLAFNPWLLLPGTGVFMMSSQLSILDLAESNLKSLPNDTLKWTSHLSYVDMSFNQLSFVNISSCGVADLVTLSNNQIQHLTERYFTFVCLSITLNLKANPIQTVDPDVIASLHVSSLELGSYPLSNEVLTNITLGISKSNITKLSIVRGSVDVFPTCLYLPLRDSSLAVLDLSRNNLNNLHPLVFSNLTKLVELRISENNLPIREIQPDFFKGMDDLKVMEIPANQIRQINPYNQSWSIYISELYLASNLITEISGFSFRGLGNLTTLDMSSNEYLSVFELTDFSGLGNIQRITLTGSRISVLELHTPTLKSLSMNSVAPLLVLRPGKSFKHLQSLVNLNMRDSGRAQSDLWNVTTNTSLFNRLLNLGHLDLSRNIFLSVGELPPGIFHPLSTLKELSLDYCSITILHPLVFSGLESLQKLSLKGNNIQSLHVVLSFLELIESINFDNNRITNLEDVTFHNNGKLKSLFLANNRLTSLNRSTFKPLVSSVTSLDLSKNLINCNCDLKWLIDWIKFNEHVHLLNKDATMCSMASLVSLRQKNLLDFDPDKLCGINIGLISCISLAVLASIIITLLVCRNRWQLKYRIFLLKLAVLGYKEMQDARDHNDYEFDINIIFFDGDEEWIREHLRPALELHLPRYQRNVFGDEDLVLGMHYLDSVDYVVTHSYKTIIVLSRAAVKDHWFILKFRTAMDHVSDTLTEFVLVVFLEDIPDDEMPFLVRLYLSDGRPYIHWTEDLRGQEFFWNELSTNLTVNLRTNDLIPNE